VNPERDGAPICAGGCGRLLVACTILESQRVGGSWDAGGSGRRGGQDVVASGSLLEDLLERFAGGEVVHVLERVEGAMSRPVRDGRSSEAQKGTRKRSLRIVELSTSQHTHRPNLLRDR
jgi:hypothetical protein